MKFRTEIEIAPFRNRISYENRVLALGSCFATHIATRLAAAKLRVTANPTGILFNPLSIAATIAEAPHRLTAEELHTDGDRWYHFGFHGDFAAPSPEEALARMNAARALLNEAIRSSDRVVLTLGTAWVYERNGRVVANCHRRPAAEFRRRRLSVGEVADTLSALFEGPLRDKPALLTVSPVRHLGDGLEGNAASKATLRLAVEELLARHPRQAEYFPAFEILTDDLRDYRFYADDLVHPAPQALAYIWEQCRTALLSDEARRLLPEVESIVAAAAHRPRDPHGAAHRAFCLRQLERIAALPTIDFQSEAAYFRRCIEINS